MPRRTKKLLILLFGSIIILILSIIFQPFEPEEGEWKQEIEGQNSVQENLVQ
jgi:hypothetical protein